MLKQDEAAVSPVIGTILLVAIVVLLAGGVFFLVQAYLDTTDKAPNIGFDADEGTDELTVARADPDIFWDDFNVTGCSDLEYSGGTAAVSSLPEAKVLAGDRLTGCSGDVRIVYLPTNTLLYSGNFS